MQNRPRVRTSLPLLLAASALLAAGGAITAAAYQPASLLCRLEDADLDEVSGLAASSRSDAYFFTHNDSGDEPYLYAVDRRGRTLATLRLEGASAVDWEDIARRPGAPGEAALYVGDIGDNGASREEIAVYRLPEPAVDAGRVGQKQEATGVIRYRLRYGDGPHDAETLMVQPKSGALFILTKSLSGSSLYTPSGPLRADGVTTLRKVAEVDPLALPPPPGSKATPLGGLLVTGGDISPDGKRLVICTYGPAYEWKIPNGDVAAALGTKPAVLLLPRAGQREAIAYSRDGRSLLTSSEGKHAPVHELRP